MDRAATGTATYPTVVGPPSYRYVDAEVAQRAAVEVVCLEHDGVERRPLREQRHVVRAQIIVAVGRVAQADRRRRVAPIEGPAGVAVGSGRFGRIERVRSEVAAVERGDLLTQPGFDLAGGAE